MQVPRHTNRGITLIEAIVSTALLSLAVAGPMTLAAHSIKVSGAVRNELIATHFAEEGLEAIHSLRDNVAADDTSGIGAGWIGPAAPDPDNFFATCSTPPGCVIDITQHAATNVWDNSAAVIPCPADCSSLSIIYFNPETGLYRQSAAPLTSPWVRTQFRRTILMVGSDNATDPQRQVRVMATITYPGYGGRSTIIRITQDIYNWFPELP